MTDISLEKVLGSGDAFADLSHWTKLSITGADTVTWLSGIVSGDIISLAPNLACSSSLHSSDGRLEAEFTAAVVGGSLLLVQDPVRTGLERKLAALLRPGLDVEVEDRSKNLALFAFPGREKPPIAPGSAFTKPSCLGAGIDVHALMSDRKRLTKLFSASFRLVDDATLQQWRAAQSS
jgi:hypothetical protein